MTNLNKLILTIFLAGFHLIVYSQEYVVKENDLTYSKISNKELVTIIDSFENEENKCKYFNDSTMFWINISKHKNNFYIQIASETDTNIVQGKSAYGYSSYKKHLIIIQGDSTSNIFTKSKGKRRFRYIQYSKLMIDDSFSEWQYFYVENKFKLASKSHCIDTVIH